MGRTSKTFALILSLIIISLCLTLFVAQPENPQAASNAPQEFNKEFYEQYSLVPEGYFTIRMMPLEKGDQVQGLFIINNFHYYPNRYIGGYGELITYSVHPKIQDPNSKTLYDFNSTEDTFNFTAQYSGTYTFQCFCSYIWGVENPIVPQLSLNYTVTGNPIEINLLSPSNQTYRESNVSLSYSASRLTDWAGYSLDGANNVTLWDSHNGNPSTWNITLTELSKGTHSLALYVSDEYGNMDVKTVAFSVGDTDLPSFVMLPIIIVIITLPFIAGLLFRRHRKTANLKQ